MFGGWGSPWGRGTLWPGGWRLSLAWRSGVEVTLVEGYPVMGETEVTPSFRCPEVLWTEVTLALGDPMSVENGGCFGVGDPAGECCGEMRPSGFWGQLRCSVPMTHIPERPLGSFPTAGRAHGGPDLGPSPCLAACPSLHASTQGAACLSLPTRHCCIFTFLDTQGCQSWGGTVLLTELDVGSPGTAPCAGVMPRPRRLACLPTFIALLHPGSSSPACAACRALCPEAAGSPCPASTRACFAW